MVSYKDSYLTFVNSHLAAFTNQTEKRNQEVREIGRLLSFPFEDQVKGRDPWTPNLKPGAERPIGALGIFDSQCVLFWTFVKGDRADQVRLKSTDLAG